MENGGKDACLEILSNVYNEHVKMLHYYNT